MRRNSNSTILPSLTARLLPSIAPPAGRVQCSSTYGVASRVSQSPAIQRGGVRASAAASAVIRPPPAAKIAATPRTAARTAAERTGARRCMGTLCACTLDFDQQLSKFLFAFGLVLAGLGFGQLRDVHRAEFRAAHRTKLGFLVEVVGKRLVVHGASGFGIERKVELLVPIEKETCVAKRVVAVARAGTMARYVGGVRGNFVSDDALLDVVGIRQAEVLLRRDVAEHGSAV